MNNSKVDYLIKFCTDDGLEIGIRDFKNMDVSSIIEIFREIYGWEYFNSRIYNVDWYKKIQGSTNYVLLVAVITNTREIIGTYSIEKLNDYAVDTDMAAIKPKYQKRGIAKKFVKKAHFEIMKRPNFRDVLRIEGEQRANNYTIQKSAWLTGAVVHSFIPNRLTVGDKRHLDLSSPYPFKPISKKFEALFEVFIPFNQFWRKRHSIVFLLDNKDILFFYNGLRKNFRQIKKDKLILNSSFEDCICNYKIEVEDVVNGRVEVQGLINNEIIEKILLKYSQWNLIKLKIPAIEKALSSQRIALEKGFNVLGYNPGSFFGDNIYDTITFGFFPSGINLKQFETMNIYEPNASIVEHILESISKKSYQKFH
jgi:hypothetical protein